MTEEEYKYWDSLWEDDEGLYTRGIDALRDYAITHNVIHSVKYSTYFMVKILFLLNEGWKKE